MSCILYYSKYCEHSKKLLVHLTTNNMQSDIHFICIDKRVKDPQSGKMYIIMDNGEKIVMPENIQNVPAVLLLKQNYRVLYGDEIYTFFRPQVRESVKQSTNNNMEPGAFSFASEGSSLGVMSDNFSFLDQSSDEMSTKGQGGMRQMYNYVGINDNMNQIQTPTDDFEYDKQTQGSSMSMEQLQKMRDTEMSNISNQNLGPRP
jgi:hypothetical protein